MSHFTYTGAKTNQISFPLGGIGSGCIGLAGKGCVNGFSHFAIKAEEIKLHEVEWHGLHSGFDSETISWINWQLSRE